MNKYSFIFTIVVLFNYFTLNVFAESDYYVVAIRRDKNDKEYDKAPASVQNGIDELVNDRMNDIYEIIADNKESYVDENGKKDEKIKELDEIEHLRKRGDEEKKFKFRFINKNRLQNNIEKRETKSKEGEQFDFIPFESSLVSHICPVSNYYVIIAYLTDEIVEKIKTLPNVISCKKRQPLQLSNYPLNYYNKEEILNETQWKGLSVQEERNNARLLNTYLSALSQGPYVDNTTVYDNNYYYPSSSGKGIDIYVIDDGLDVSFNNETEQNFDTYKGTENERTIECHAEFYNGEYHDPHSEKLCYIGKKSSSMNHGTIVSLLASGKVNGSSKYANIHVIAVQLDNYDVLAALDYVKQHAKPHKTVVNMSLGCNAADEKCQDQNIQDKILELVDMGVIIVVAAGNEGKSRCNIQMFEGAKGVLAIGAINDKDVKMTDMRKMYKQAYYSNYGECIVGFAPGSMRSPYFYEQDGENPSSGTSFASPLVAGIVASIMTEDPETKYTYETMRQKLIDLSIKDVISGMRDDVTPNRLINNGKRSIVIPPKCNDPSGKYSCLKESECCTGLGFCVEKDESSEFNYCLVENGCQSEFGFCDTQACGPNYNNRHCLEGEWCNKDGKCIKMENDKNDSSYIENGCMSEYGEKCFTYDVDKIDEYDEKYREKILTNVCLKEVNERVANCDIQYYLPRTDEATRKTTCEKYRANECYEFYDDPVNKVKACKILNYPIQLSMNTYVVGTQNMYCGKKESGDYCMDDINALYNNTYLFDELDMKQFCPHRECYESITKFVDGYYETLVEYESMLGQDYFKTEKDKLKNHSNMLSSSECTGKQVTTTQTVTATKTVSATQTSTTTTTTTATSTTTKSTKSKKSKTSKTKKTKTPKTKSTKTETTKTKATKTKTTKTKTTKTTKSKTTKSKTNKSKNTKLNHRSY